MFNKKKSCLPRWKNSSYTNPFYKGMKNYITKEALPGILEHLAEKFLEHDDNVAVKVELITYNNSNPILEIEVSQNGTWTRLVKKEYEIINGIKDSYDVVGDTVTEALQRVEKFNQEEEI